MDIDIAKGKKIIKKFVKSTIDDYDIERTDMDEWHFKDIDALYEFNDIIINNLDDTMVMWLCQLIKYIKKDKICNMDKETMVPFPTSGFCWNLEGKLVIFNER